MLVKPDLVVVAGEAGVAGVDGGGDFGNVACGGAGGGGQRPLAAHLVKPDLVVVAGLEAWPAVKLVLPAVRSQRGDTALIIKRE